MTMNEIAALQVGTRVVFPKGWDAYPDFFFAERLCGAVSRVEADSVWVRLDDVKPELAEWDNEVQIWLWPEEADGDSYDGLVELA